MKIFWKDRNGKKAPLGASFHCIPFFPDQPPLDLSQAIRVENLPAPSPPIRVLNKQFFPENQEWNLSVTKSTDAIRQGSFHKVVLARCCVLECETKPDPFAIAAALQEKSQNATLFCFANDEMAFLGATPEFLFTRNQNALFTEAIAGTVRRGETERQDQKFENELLSSAKAHREVLPVQNFLQEKLFPLCLSPLQFSPVFVKKTANVQHLASHATALLKSSTKDSDILKQIHPTPALCGLPQGNAFEWIRGKEPFDRKFFGAAIGWSTEDASQWAVAIRCCHIQNNFVSLYTGVGIVEGSDPQEEWEELNAKMDLYRGIFL